jgi:hypothetical protein
MRKKGSETSYYVLQGDNRKKPKHPIADTIADLFGSTALVFFLLYVAWNWYSPGKGSLGGGLIIDGLLMAVAVPTAGIFLLARFFSKQSEQTTAGYVIIALGILGFIIIMLLNGCAERTPVKDAGNNKTDNAGVYVDVINYNYDRSYQFTLYDLTREDKPPISGGIVWPLASGGNVNCCVSLPRVWRPGLKVLLKWGEADEKTKEEIARHEHEFEIPRYKRPGNLYIVYMPESEVQLVVSEVEPGSDKWPGQVKQTPWDYCVKTNGRKPCKAAVAKTYPYQGFCTNWNRRGPKELERDRRLGIDGSRDLCKESWDRCLYEYEDEEFCNKVLWGKEPKGCHDLQGHTDWCEDQKDLSNEDKKKYLLDWEKEQ